MGDEAGTSGTNPSHDGGTAPKRLCIESVLKDLSAELDQDGEEPMEMDEIENSSEKDSFDDEEKGCDDTEQYSQGPPLLRNYQSELAKAACEGTSTIICAPTGSGKTRVAIHIIQKHLEKEQSGKKSKVVFLARTGPLVSQQFKALQKWLPNFEVTEISGQTSYRDSAHHFLENFDVLVMTPKILENHLDPEMIASLEEFSLIIFDECHHTRGGEPYNSLMKAYFKEKNDGKENLPQIVGLTASIGVEKAASADKAADSIYKLMANMDVKHISRVRNDDNKQELESFAPMPDEVTKQLRPRGEDKVSKCIVGAMTSIEELLNQEFPTTLEDPEIREVKSSQQKRPADRKSQKYGQWARSVCRNVNLVHIPEFADDEFPLTRIEILRKFSQNVRLLAETLVFFNEALDVHELSRPEDVLTHLERKLKPQHQIDTPECSQLEEKLRKLLRELKVKLEEAGKADKSGNPNLEKLADVIKEKLHEKWESSRVMVFVPTRATCVALCSWLNSKAVLPQLQQLKAKPFTGTGAKQDLGGMTQNDQEDVIQKFRAGEVRLLVCTSVGQEGMDIPDCNLVIRYNHVGNEVATVQTRGRCRKAGGISALLAMPEVVKQEIINRSRVRIMNEALKKVDIQSSVEINKRVEEAQGKATNTTLKRKKPLPRETKKSPNSFVLECRGCRKVRLQGSKIRTIKGCHHVIIGEDLEKDEQVTVQGLSKPVYVDGNNNIEFYGKILCNRCPATRQSVLGTVSKHEGVEYHTIKAPGWIVLDAEKNNKPIKVGKWKWGDVDEMYNIPELTSDDVSAYLGVS